MFVAEWEAGRGEGLPWWLWYLRAAQRWGCPPWEIVEGTADDRGWPKPSWVLAQQIADAAEAAARERLRERDPHGRR